MREFREIARRIYHEAVKGRSAVKLAKPGDRKLEHSPLFLTGIYRSGTTLVRYIVDSHSQICCPPESDFISSFSMMHQDSYSMRGLADMGFDEDHVIQKMRELAIYFFGNYAAAKEKPRWADKSPAYVDHLDYIDKMFPEALYIIIHRHPLDQVHSITRGGTNLFDRLVGEIEECGDYRPACTRYWCEQTNKILKFQSDHQDKCISIRYEDLCDNPEDNVKMVLDHAGLEWEPEVLEFYKQKHDKGKEDGRVIATRGFSVSKGNYKNWPPALIDECANIARDEMELLGYTV